MRVVVHIDELHLHGFRGADRHAIADAVQRELQAMLTASPPQLRHGATLDAVTAPAIRQQATAPANGRAIAGALHCALTGTRR